MWFVLSVDDSTLVTLRTQRIYYSLSSVLFVICDLCCLLMIYSSLVDMFVFVQYNVNISVHYCSICMIIARDFCP